MTFEAPLFLLGLLLLPLGALLYAQREGSRRAGAEAFAPAALLPSVVPRRAGWRRHAPVIGYALALAALIVALSRPQATLATGVEQATVVVVTDRSGSMLATDVAPDRITAARSASRELLQTVPDDVRIGAIAFNHTVQVLHSPTADHAAVAEGLDAVEAAGSTATGDALQAALRMIESSRRPGEEPPPAAIVLLSDGESVRGSDPLEAAEQARQAGVPVHTIALGTQGGTIERTTRTGAVRVVPVPPDRETLAQIARRSGGESFATADAVRLDSVYERLGSQVARENRPREVTSLFAGGALLLMVVAAGASLRWFGRFL